MIACPICKKPAPVKAYGSFFTPDPTYRLAATCPEYHWRGRMCATREEAEGA